MQPERWRRMIAAAAKRTEPGVVACTFHHALDGVTQPVLLRADDGRDYVVKGKQAGRATVNDHLVGLLGNALQAPVPEVRIVRLPAELIDAEPQLRHMSPGLAHGSLFVKSCVDADMGDEEVVRLAGVGANRVRFARLAVLFGWVRAGDRQYIHLKGHEPIVYSVDHGHFFPDGPNWTPESLQAAPRPSLDAQLRRACRFTASEVNKAAEPLQAVKDSFIAKVVSSLPDEWGVPEQDRVAMACYLDRRRDELLKWIKRTFS